jgi:nucleotide-binding universal stress UspA family protein
MKMKTGDFSEFEERFRTGRQFDANALRRPKASTKAFATAVALTKTNRANLTILHVSVPLMPVVPEQYIGGATLEQLNADARWWAQRQLAKLTEKTKKVGVRTVGLMIEGEPARHIVRAARSKRADRRTTQPKPFGSGFRGR